MEIALRRLDGVDKVSISISQQTFEVFYKPGASFRPADLRGAVGQADVSVVQFRIFGSGQVRQEGGKRFFVAGKDKFLLVDSPALPADTPLLILGTVNDSANPLELKVTDFKPAKE